MIKVNRRKRKVKFKGTKPELQTELTMLIIRLRECGFEKEELEKTFKVAQQIIQEEQDGIKDEIKEVIEKFIRAI